jgi:hypothetical protein
VLNSQETGERIEDFLQYGNDVMSSMQKATRSRKKPIEHWKPEPVF